MGCDIHWYSETRKDGAWVCDQASTFYIEKAQFEDERDYPQMDDFPGRQRDYWFFGLLNKDVRSHWEYSFQGKGDIPNCSAEVQTKIDYWSDDGHSHSWLSRQELQDKLAELERLKAELLIAPRTAPDMRPDAVDHHIARLKHVIENLVALSPGASAEDHRIVFWFDN